MARKRRTKTAGGGIDISLFITLMIMLAFGLIMVFSASAPSAFYEEGNQLYYIKKQLVWTAIGLVAMFLISNVNYKLVKKYAGLFCAATFVLMVLVILMGVTGGGAQRWIKIGGITLQPSEIAKFALILLFAKKLSEQPQKRLRHFSGGLTPYLFLIAVFCGAMVLQDHLSAAIITAATLIVMLAVAGADLKQLFVLMIVGVAIAIPLVFFEGYRANRIKAYLDPFAYKDSIGWQIVEGLYAIGSGGIFGRGLGQSRQKFLYVPEAHNDYIYAILCEELGLMGAIIVMVLFAVFITRCIKIALAAPDKFSSLSVFGITTLIGFQYIINIGVVTGVIPNTGMQLPFFSAGGSSLVFMLAAMGFVFNVSRYVKKEEEIPKGELNAL